LVILAQQNFTVVFFANIGIDRERDIKRGIEGGIERGIER
jgi:hypothetical protein